MERHRFAMRVAVVLLSVAPLVGPPPANAASPPRVAIEGDTLVVEGGPGDDRILISGAARPDTVRVLIAGRSAGRFGPVARILVKAGDGHDRVLVNPTVTLPVRIDGGPGNDVLRGGAGPDLLKGEEGDDLLIGSRGRDALHTGAGRDRLVVSGSMGDIHVGGGARGEALRILSTAYTLRPLHAGSGRTAAAGPIIVGRADLGDAAIAERVKAAYGGGHAIGLTSSDAAAMEQLRRLLGHSSGITWDASAGHVDLLVLRRATRPDGHLHEMTALLFPRVAVPLPAGHAGHGRRKADARTVAQLSAVFSATPFAPDPAPGDNGPDQNLVDLATSYESQGIQSDTSGNTIQVINNLWSVRSFLNQSDFYYVQQNVNVEYGGSFPAPDSSLAWDNRIITRTPVGASLIEPTPQSTQETETVSATTSHTVGGSVGFNETQGFDASVSGSVTVGKTVTTSVPPIVITMNSNFQTGEANWNYRISQFPSGQEPLSFVDAWIWQVPWALYGNLGVDAFPYNSVAAIEFNRGSVDTYEVRLPQFDVVVPFPFGQTFAIAQPVVTGVSPACVRAGDEFTIAGTGLYPSLLVGVLIDGAALGANQFASISDTEITVVAPDVRGTALPVVVQTTQGVSPAGVTVTIHPSCPRRAAAGPGP
jgi:hypothetical protein